MPITKVADVEGNTFQFFEFRGKYFPIFPVDMDEVLSNLPNLDAREEDVTLLAYPKAGTNWLWEVVNMLQTGKDEVNLNRMKGESMLEIVSSAGVDKLPSVRLLNSHVTPEFYPNDLVKKKSKIIYILRNPKDVFVSFFHHTKKFKLYDYQGTWNGYFELQMAGKTDYGCWFEYTKAWDKFFKEHPDLPVLTVYYEDMKKDFPAGIKKLAEFLDVPCDKDLLDRIVEKCTFASLKKARDNMPAAMKNFVVEGNSNPLFRKGIIGDWKNHFTVAQNERFDATYKTKMNGYSFDFEQYM